MTLIAVTDIKYGEEDGSVTRVEAGTEVTDEFPEEVLEELREAGAVKDLTDLVPAGPTQDRIAELEAEVSRLRAAAEANGIDLDPELEEEEEA